MISASRSWIRTLSSLARPYASLQACRNHSTRPPGSLMAFGPPRPRLECPERAAASRRDAPPVPTTGPNLIGTLNAQNGGIIRFGTGLANRGVIGYTTDSRAANVRVCGIVTHPRRCAAAGIRRIVHGTKDDEISNEISFTPSSSTSVRASDGPQGRLQSGPAHPGEQDGEGAISGQAPQPPRGLRAQEDAGAGAGPAHDRARGDGRACPRGRRAGGDGHRRRL